MIKVLHRINSLYELALSDFFILLPYLSKVSSNGGGKLYSFTMNLISLPSAIKLSISSIFSKNKLLNSSFPIIFFGISLTKLIVL